MRPPTIQRAWRFVHPDLDEHGGAPGLRLGVTGGIGMVDEEAAVRQSLLLLLSTVPGERVMRPEYGCDLHRLVFSPNDDTTAGLAIHYVRQAVTRWEPRVKILRLDARAARGAPSRLEIVLDYRLRTRARSEALAFTLDLAGEEAR